MSPVIAPPPRNQSQLAKKASAAASGERLGDGERGEREERAGARRDRRSPPPPPLSTLSSLSSSPIPLQAASPARSSPSASSPWTSCAPRCRRTRRRGWRGPRSPPRAGCWLALPAWRACGGGTGPTVARLSAGLALQFLAIDALKDWALGQKEGGGQAPEKGAASKSAAGAGKKNTTTGLSARDALLVGGGARCLSSAATAPLTLVKTRMEYAGGRHAYTSTAQALGSIARAEGLRGLFRGLGPTVAANAPFSALYLAFYTSLQARLAASAPGLAGSPAANFGLGAAAAVAATVLTQPADVVRTHMQLGLGGGAGAGAGVGRALRAALKAGGPAALLAGTAPRVVKRTLQTALVWTLYEELQPRLAGLAGEGGGGGVKGALGGGGGGGGGAGRGVRSVPAEQ